MMNDPVGDFDIDALKKQLRDKHKRRFRPDDFVLQTLDQFAHRYLASDGQEAAKAVQIDDSCYGFKSIETDVARTLGHMSDEAVAERIRCHSPKTLLCGLYVEIRPLNSGGQTQILSFINWAGPDFPMIKDKMVQREEVIDFEDPLELRNKLPVALESVCLLFV